MASIYIINKGFDICLPNLFKPAITTSEVIIGSFFKLIYENSMLQFELMIYMVIFGIILTQLCLNEKRDKSQSRFNIYFLTVFLVHWIMKYKGLFIFIKVCFEIWRGTIGILNVGI